MADVSEDEQILKIEDENSVPCDKEKLNILRNFIIEIMRTHTCYELIPESAKVVVFDAKLHIRHAIRALLDHDIKCAPVWEPSYSQFVGMITITDFIQILLETYNTSTSLNERLDAMTVGEWSSWSRQNSKSSKPHIIGCYPDENIFKAARLLHRHFIHRLPILQKGFDTSILCILNHQSIMRFLFQHVPPDKSHLLMTPVEQLGVGWYEDVISTSQSSPLIDVVRMLRDKTITALPILDEEGKVVDAFSRSDIRFLVADSNIKETCEQPVRKFLEQHHNTHWIPRCTKKDSVQKVVMRMLDARKHSCMIVKESDDRSLLGILTLRNIFAFFFENEDINEPINPLGPDETSPTAI